MVLDNATAADSTFFDPGPSSDIDPNSSSSSNASDANYPSRPGRYIKVSQTSYRDGRQVAEPIYINVNDLPQPPPLFGPRRLPEFISETIAKSCAYAADVLQRPVSQDEANAIAFHHTKALCIAAYGSPIGCAAGAAMAWRTRNSMRFPFWDPFKEGSKYSKDRFFFGQTGGRARFSWHTLRFGAYSTVSVIVAQIFFGSYALSTTAAGRALDPRLKELTQALQQRSKNGLGRARSEGTGKIGNQESGPKGSESYEMARQRVQAQNTMRRNRQSGMVSDDASPTGGAFSDEYLNQSDEPGFMDEQDVRQQVDSRSGWSEDPQTSTQDNTAARRRSEDDASPQASSKPAGSAWERLRSQALSSPPDTPRRQSRGPVPPDTAGARLPGAGREAASGRDNFSFSSSDEERQFAKSEAQRDFDQRVEREREGREFGDEAGRGRWS